MAEHLAGKRLCLADWQRVLGGDFERVRARLVKCVGEIAKSYPAPGTGLRLAVRECKSGYIAHPVGDFDHDAEDLRLTEQDVQVWRLVGRETVDRGPQTADRRRETGDGGDITVLELKTHLDHRFDTLGREFSDLQKENEALKQDLARVLSNLARKVDPVFFQWIFVILGTGSVNAAARALDVPGATFADRLQRYVARGGVYKTLFAMVGARRKGAGQRRIERFNELFEGHQGEPAVGGPGVWRELLDGLEALNGANWKAMREELIGIVRTEYPEE